MTLESELADLQTFITGRPALGVAVVAATPAPDPRPGEPATLSLAEDARDFFYDVIDRAIGRPLERDLWRLRPLDPVYKPDVLDVEYAALDDVPAVALACEAYANLGPYPDFTGDAAFVKRLAHYVAVLGAPGDEQAFFFRSFSSAAELKRKRGAALARRDGQFARIEDKVFVFDEAIDCFVFRQRLFVIRKGDYRRVFDQFEALRARAVEAATALNQQVPIENFDGFRDACSGQAAMADKLVAVQGRDYFDGLTIDRLKPIIAEFELDVELVERDGRDHLVFKPDPQHRWLILKLLDDDYLRSTMTDLRYEANSKLRAGSH